MSRWMKYVCPECGVIRRRLWEHYQYDKSLAERRSRIREDSVVVLTCRKCGKPIKVEDAPELTAFSDFLERTEKMKISRLSWPEQSGIYQDLLRINQNVRSYLRPSGKGREARKIFRETRGDMKAHGWLDHPDFDGDTFISEPYTLGIPTLKNLIQFCEKNNLELTISGRSWWNPGDTLRIELEKKKKIDFSVRE